MQSVNRIRKTPEQRIAEARAALQRAKEAQRRVETRQKIIIGSTAIEWLKSNPDAARGFVSHLAQKSTSQNDLSVINPILQQLRQVIHNSTSD